ncbi:MAG TPA: TlpA disulfide reductase family protein, partial [Candidatus Polarisedimenticolaceae bacterium]|nr:TlpA disulfide reductase family protein [Candidatus Polarisedimenticolaceae bacterium]
LAAAVGLDDGTTRLSWIAAGSATPLWTVGLDTGTGRLERAAAALAAAQRNDEARPLFERAHELGAGVPPGAKLTAERWHLKRPDFELPLLDGGRYPLSQASGRVLVFDFWASWCKPCIEELPLMQALYDAHRERGLEVIAINVDEPPAAALDFARRFGLTMPLSRYVTELDRAFDVKNLPTVMLFDRGGRLRNRWDGFPAGQQKVVSDAVRTVLDERDGPPPVELADVLAGAGTFEVAWAREASGAIGGLAVLPRGPLIVSTSDQLVHYDASGALRTRTAGPALGTRLRVIDGDLLAVRPGGRRISLYTLADGESRDWDVPAAVFEASPWTPGPGIVLATLEGLVALDGTGQVVARSSGLATTSSVQAVSTDAVKLVAVEAGRRVVWLDGSLRIVEQAAAPADAWALVTDPLGRLRAGVAGPSVVAAVSGRFLEGHGVQAALATTAGQLVIVDLDTGALLERLRWPDLAALSAADLDGDGRNELVVASRGWLALLRPGEPKRK